jgi:hypothetical protein
MTIMLDLVDIYQCNLSKLILNYRFKSMKSAIYFYNQFDFIKEKFLFFVSYKTATHDIQGRFT